MKIVICSLRYSPGHAAHLKAYGKMFRELGQETLLCLAPEYKEHGMGEGVLYTTSPRELMAQNPQMIFVYNIGLNHILLELLAKKAGCSCYYILHEPWPGLRELLKEGNGVPKAIAAHMVNWVLCTLCSKVILASRNGMELYKNHSLGWNQSYVYFPLIRLDEYNGSKKWERKYFSYIGTYTAAHSADKFLQLVEYAETAAPDITFLLATRSNVGQKLETEALRRAIASGRFVVQTGRVLTEEELQQFYGESLCVWNVYQKSVQSGVLPNAMMLGTPVVAGHEGVSDQVIVDQVNSCVVESSTDFDGIIQQFNYIRTHIHEISTNARSTFLQEYCYSGQLELARELFLQGDTNG